MVVLFLQYCSYFILITSLQMVVFHGVFASACWDDSNYRGLKHGGLITGKKPTMHHSKRVPTVTAMFIPRS